MRATLRLLWADRWTGAAIIAAFPATYILSLAACVVLRALFGG
jgi:hypothetical protein